MLFGLLVPRAAEILFAKLAVVSAVRDVHRARAAADLAALSAAQPLVVGGAPDCAAGAIVAAANGAHLIRCASSTDGSVDVTATVQLRWSAWWAGLPDRATARARAGLVEDEPP